MRPEKHPCDQCSHQANTPSNLKRHKKAKHESINNTPLYQPIIKPAGSIEWYCPPK